MDLQQQIQALIDAAPQDGQTSRAIAAIAPVLSQLAQQLNHAQYYIVQSRDHRWQITTLQRRQQSEQKTVVYAFSNRQDAAAGNPQLLAVSEGVISLLFQLLALEGVDSLIFLDYPGDLQRGIEIQRQHLQNLVQQQLQQSLGAQPIPPDMA